MRLTRSARTAALLAVLLVPGVAHSAGYSIYEQGARALGMAGANTASVNDGSALFYNPAALTKLEGKQLYMGGTWLTTRNSFAGVDPFPGNGTTEEMKSGNFFPPTVYWTNHIGKSDKLAYGVGVNAPFGLGVEWQNPETFTGRDRVTKAQLTTLNTNLSLAYALNPHWSVAAGFNALFAKVELNSIKTFVTDGGLPVNVAKAKLTSDFTPGYAFNGGVLLTPNDTWRFGLTYRSKTEVSIDDGKAEFTQILSGDPVFDGTIAAGLPVNQGVATTLKFPALWSFGAAWNPTPAWTWEIDGNWHQWSEFDELPLTFKTDPTLNQTVTENYEDQFQVRVGAEHRLENYHYRVGYYFDEAAAPTESVTPLLPDANRHGATLGLGWKLGKWNVDVYNLFLFVEKRSTDGIERDGYNGVYKAYVNALGASFAYHW